MYFLRLLTFVVLTILASSCDKMSSNESQQVSRSLAAIKASGKLVVLTRNAPTTWYIGRNGEPNGPEYEMVEAFAAAIGVKSEYKKKQTIQAILDGIEKGEADLAAAGLTVTEARRARFRFGPSYQDVTQQIVCRRDNVQPETFQELVGLNLVVIAGSSYTERLKALKAGKYPDLTWSETDSKNTEQLLRDVWQRRIDCTVADSSIVDINRRYYPELIAPLNLSRVQQLGWLMLQSSKDLDEAVTDWMKQFKESGRLDHLQERYYGFFEAFDYVDISVYISRIDKRFAKYREYFRKAARKYDLSYLLLAAQSYQESHWNARAQSPTGVRGIMMLTRHTAKAMGVENRLDPRQSIFGGAKYMARLRKRFVKAITEPDRTWLALAAYNIGRAHLHDAQLLARKMHLSPYLWRDLKQVLPLLADKRYYKDLKYGYARGSEPVRYVQRIREYQHVLRNYLK